MRRIKRWIGAALLAAMVLVGTAGPAAAVRRVEPGANGNSWSGESGHGNSWSGGSGHDSGGNGNSWSSGATG